MRHENLRFPLVPALLLGACLAAPLSAQDASWLTKVDPWVLERTERTGDKAEFLVVLAHQADLAGAVDLKGKDAKGRFVFERLTEAARLTQGPLLAELRARGLAHRPFWVANMIWVEGGRDDVRALAARADVARVSANPRVKISLPQPGPQSANTPTAVEPGVAQVGAPTFWAQGFTGQGIVVSGHDTGYDWDHPALKDKYRGWDGLAANHNFNWHDSIHSGGGVCGANSALPCDDSSHGTHTMGTMVGDDGGANQVGVAPGARWMGCRNMDQGNGTPTTYSECFQFFIAPTDLANANPDPSKSPHVINNSWGCPPSEGCTDPLVMQTVVENTRAAGIVVVVSAGNSGSSCNTVDTPAAIYDAVFTVGATNNGESIASLSSRGPVTVDGSNRLKPDITAPGISVRSSVPGTGYGFKSGTSMAGPHVAGVVAVLLSASPALVGDVDAIEDCLIAMATPRTSTQNCGTVPGSQVPNNTFGHGTVQLVWPLPAACVPSGIFEDGFETGDTSMWTLVVP